MIFKYVFIAFLGVILYKMVFPKKRIDTTETDQKSEEYTDYEEIED